MTAPGLKQLLNIIEQQLDWGDAATWQSKDFENLNELILEKTKISLSASTLRRVWGRVEYNHLPSGTTLDTLARFAGYDSWRAFTRENHTTEAGQNDVKGSAQQAPPPTSQQKNGKWRLRAALIIVAIITISLVSMYAKKTATPIAKNSFSFDSRPITRTIPNSVIFTYDVKANPTDSVFIQQSWDPGTRARVDKNLHKYTSIYYKPGFYHAKLEVNDKIVSEKLLMIPTDGWLGLISQQPVPLYLNTKEFKSKDMMDIPVSVIRQNKISLVPQPPEVEYYNVGNFTPVSLKDFSFETEVRNDYHDGAAACQFVSVILFTDNVPVIVQLCTKGCVSDLRLLNGRYFVSGKNNDLSGFGADLSQWVKVSCKSIPGKIQYYINDKLAYESQLPLYNENIVGLGYAFQGTGAVRKINLSNHDKTVFKDF